MRSLSAHTSPADYMKHVNENIQFKLMPVRDVPATPPSQNLRTKVPLDRDGAWMSPSVPVVGSGSTKRDQFCIGSPSRRLRKKTSRTDPSGIPPADPEGIVPEQEVGTEVNAPGQHYEFDDEGERAAAEMHGEDAFLFGGEGSTACGSAAPCELNDGIEEAAPDAALNVELDAMIGDGLK
jgi:hypothetical protein